MTPRRRAMSAASVRRVAPSFCRIRDTCTPTVRGLITNAAAISAFVRPAARSGRISSSRWVRPSSAATATGPVSLSPAPSPARRIRADPARVSTASCSGRAPSRAALRRANASSRAASRRPDRVPSRACARRQPSTQRGTDRLLPPRRPLRHARGCGVAPVPSGPLRQDGCSEGADLRLTVLECGRRVTFVDPRHLRQRFTMRAGQLGQVGESAHSQRRGIGLHRPVDRDRLRLSGVIDRLLDLAQPQVGLGACR